MREKGRETATKKTIMEETEENHEEDSSENRSRQQGGSTDYRNRQGRNDRNQGYYKSNGNGQGN